MYRFRSLSLAAIGVVFAAAMLSAQGQAQDKPASTVRVVLASQVAWTQLNPLRGDASPRAANLWGQRTKPGPAGFLLKPADGFRSPPHIHNIAYRGVVIRGLLHNDDPGAADLDMSAGSFWTQPAGEVHITACKGDCLAYIEVDNAFGVLPAAKAFKDPERAINVHISNIVWIDQPGQAIRAGGPKVAYLWGNPRDAKPAGALFRLPPGSRGVLVGFGPSLHAVVIQGQTRHAVRGKSAAKTLPPGSYFGSTGRTVHRVTCASARPCLFYVRARGRFSAGAARR